ncbi:hypothetical protein RE6C_05632 [Rhodopirellula europaea 6C]|uniref:Uncharacterized protein n=1 Tax=Rhodopirellula europaea 6C TaxID=1263867 RepID=M2AUE7_9BACT|nr:hypothetical protein RE6C_05632 [Rhodopirellula europaea 6C]
MDWSGGEECNRNGRSKDRRLEIHGTGSSASLAKQETDIESIFHRWGNSGKGRRRPFPVRPESRSGWAQQALPAFDQLPVTFLRESVLW